MQVLQSFYEMYQKSSLQDNYSSKDLTLLRHYHPNSDFHRQIQQSSAYMGYKLLWIIHLFLNGKNFPQGHIEDENWRTYINDIMQFLSDREIIKSIIQIDCEQLFQII